jgi:predicted secreted protein
MARIWNIFTTKLRDGTFTVPLVLLFLIGVDFWAFLDLFIRGGQNPFLSIMIASLVAVALDIVPYFLIIALITHIGSLMRTGPAAGAGEDASAVAKRRISRIVIVFAAVATLALLSWVTLMRLDVINEEGRASFARFEAAEAEDRVVNSNNVKVNELTGGTIIGNAGFKQHWHIAGTEPVTDDFGNEVFNAAGDVQMQYKEVYGYYPGFHVHRIMLIAAWTTTFIAMLLSAFYFKAYWWHETLERITNMSGETARLAEIRRVDRTRREEMRTERAQDG